MKGLTPSRKGLVENLCGYVQTDLIVPALLEQDWPDLATANAAARNWCTEVNQQVHSEIGAIPAERLVSGRRQVKGWFVRWWRDGMTRYMLGRRTLG